jgi:DNA polymerase V
MIILPSSTWYYVINFIICYVYITSGIALLIEAIKKGNSVRTQGCHASLMQVSLYINRYRKDLPQYNPSLTLPSPQPTNDSLVVNRWADYLVGRLFKPEYSYKKAGIMLGEITPVSHYEADFFEPTQARDTRLMDALDGLNKRFGRGTVKVSTQGAHNGWQMRQERKSPSYTTDWDSIPCV